MRRLEVEAEATARVPPETIWALVADANRYAEWGPWRDGGYEPASDGPSAVGMVQWFQSKGRTRSVERILEIDDGRRLVYTVIDGYPVRNYRAEIALTTTAEGTRIRWAATWDPTLLGYLVRLPLKSFYRQMMKSLVGFAEGSVP